MQLRVSFYEIDQVREEDGIQKTSAVQSCDDVVKGFEARIVFACLAKLIEWVEVGRYCTRGTPNVLRAQWNRSSGKTYLLNSGKI